MNRITFALVVTACLSSSATAIISTPKPVAPRQGDGVVPVPKAERPEAAVKQTNEFGITPGTEVVLDGRECVYKDVPATASVVRIELARDRKSVLRIEFRAKK